MDPLMERMDERRLTKGQAEKEVEEWDWGAYGVKDF